MGAQTTTVALLGVLSCALAGCPAVDFAEPGKVYTLTAKSFQCWADHNSLWTGKPATVLEVHDSWDEFHQDWESHFESLAREYAGQRRLTFARIACGDNEPACDSFPQHERHSILFLREGWRPGESQHGSEPQFPAGTAHTEPNVKAWINEQLRVAGIKE